MNGRGALSYRITMPTFLACGQFEDDHGSPCAYRHLQNDRDNYHRDDLDAAPLVAEWLEVDDHQIQQLITANDAQPTNHGRLESFRKWCKQNHLEIST